MFKLASLVALVTLAAAPASAQNFDRAAWIADFEQAKAAITDHSPNLDWALARGMDLPALETLTRARLDASTDDAAARRALDRFIAAFGDGHMEIAWPSHAPAPTTSQAPPDICGSLGFWTSPDTGAIGMHIPGYDSVTPEGGVIEAGVAPVGGSRIGVLRIDQFAPSARICARALGELSLSPTDPCDELCADQVQHRADALFLDEVSARIRGLAAQRPRALMIDLAQNGGGSATAIAIARMVVGTRLAAPVMGVARSPERALDLQETADLLQAQSVDPDAAAFLAPLISNLRRAQQEAATPCDMSAIWSSARPGCSNLVLGPFYAGGLVAQELPQRFRSAPWAEYISETAGYQYQPELWRGPVIVLVDRYSASAAELFAAMLQDGAHATVIGAPTYGAGCGWNLPHQDVILTHSGGALALPNCARLRADGSNEIDGITPDVMIGFRQADTTAQRVARLMAALPIALERAVN